MWRALFAYSGDREVASDAVAEAFAQVMSRGDAVRSPGAWVWQAAFRIAAGELQRRSRANAPTNEESYELPQPLDHVFSAMRRLSPNQRAAVLMHDYADRPPGEIAAALGMSRATVYVHLSQGRRRLRSLLEDSADA
jgi:RNA polymerase sigma-70 factor, ECF subfamily